MVRWFERLLRYRRRSLTFTSLGLRFVLITLAIGLGAINTGNNLLYLVLALLLSLITLSGVLSEQCLRRLEVTRRMAATIFALEPTPVSLVVTNRKRIFPSFLLHLGESPGPGRTTVGSADPPIMVLPPGATRSVVVRVTFDRRGPHTLEGTVASTKFPFGLFTKQLMMPMVEERLVFPALLPHGELGGLINPQGQELARARRGHGTGFFSLRDYQGGDDARSIHWKSSARQSKLLVKESEQEEHRAVTLVLDRRWPAESAAERDAALYQSRFERSVSLAATLAVEWTRRGWRLGLITGGQPIPSGQGRAHLEKILRALALAPPIGHGAGEEPAPEQLLRQRAPDDFWVVLLVSDDGAWPVGEPTIFRRLVTCPNEPARAGREEG